MIEKDDIILPLFFKKNILVTGANGQLGSELRQIAGDFPDFNFLFTTRVDFPLENAEAINDFFERQQIHYCINCAAYTAVDKAEENREEAFLINAEAPARLASFCRDHQAKLIHISTDYVYDGSRHIALKEQDAVAPLNVYGWSKLRGEELLLNKNPSALIIRTSWVYSSFGNNFVKTILRLSREKQTLNVINDQFGCPTYARNIAGAIMNFIISSENDEQFQGIFNYCDEGITSWFDFAIAITTISGIECEIKPVTTAQYQTPAKRPMYSVLDTTKIKTLLHLKIPSWQQSLLKCLALIDPNRKA
ncbi:MAG: dTDP-4-dehydrorhamnose reductase [Ginsengibacter sp.]